MSRTLADPGALKSSSLSLQEIQPEYWPEISSARLMLQQIAISVGSPLSERENFDLSLIVLMADLKANVGTFTLPLKHSDHFSRNYNVP